jgi:hypothetical protein
MSVVGRVGEWAAGKDGVRHITVPYTTLDEMRERVVLCDEFIASWEPVPYHQWLWYPEEYEKRSTPPVCKVCWEIATLTALGDV